jgi:hypothetical protein
LPPHGRSAALSSPGLILKVSVIPAHEPSRPSICRCESLPGLDSSERVLLSGCDGSCAADRDCAAPDLRGPPSLHDPARAPVVVLRAEHGNCFHRQRGRPTQWRATCKVGGKECRKVLRCAYDLAVVPGRSVRPTERQRLWQSLTIVLCRMPRSRSGLYSDVIAPAPHKSNASAGCLPALTLMLAVQDEPSDNNRFAGDHAEVHLDCLDTPVDNLPSLLA